jgi:hypothetical protein
MDNTSKIQWEEKCYMVFSLIQLYLGVLLPGEITWYSANSDILKNRRAEFTVQAVLLASSMI